MSIAEVGSGSQRASAQSNSLPLTRAFPANVTTGSLIVVWAMQVVVGATPNYFQPSDITKSAGTATLGPITLDLSCCYRGDNCFDVVVWSAIVTGGGSLTMQCNGTTGAAFNLIVDEFSGNWTANRLVDHSVYQEYQDGGPDPDSRPASSTGAALMIGGLVTATAATDVQNVQNSFTTIWEQLTPVTNPNGAATFRIVSSQTTTSALWTGSSNNNSICAALAVFQEGDNAAIYPVSGIKDGSVASGVTSKSHAFPYDVTAGDLIVVSGFGWNASSAHTFVAGDCTKTAGTATIDTPTLDKQITAADGANRMSVGLWSAIVTGSGSLTMQVAGMPASSDVGIGVDALHATAGWDDGRVEASNGQVDESGSGNAIHSGNVTTAGRAVLYGAKCSNYSGAAYMFGHQSDFARGFYSRSELWNRSAETCYDISQSGVTEESSDYGPVDVWASIIVAYRAGVPVIQLGRPGSDISTGNWTPSSGGSLAAMVDEETADDSDYIQSGDNPTADTARLRFAGLSTPATRDNHKFPYRIRGSGGCPLTVALYDGDGTTLIKTVTHNPAPAVWTDQEMDFSAEASTITDYPNLELRLVAN